MGLTGSGLFHLKRSPGRGRLDVERAESIEVVDIEVIDDAEVERSADEHPGGSAQEQPIAQFAAGLVDDSEPEDGPGTDGAGPDGGTEGAMAVTAGGGGHEGEPAGLFDTGPSTPQIMTRARAAEEDFQRRAQALAARAPGILERLGNLTSITGSATARAEVAGVTARDAKPGVETGEEKTADPTGRAEPDPSTQSPMTPTAISRGRAAARPVPPQPVTPGIVTPPPGRVGTQSGSGQQSPVAPISDVLDAVDRLRVLAQMLDEGLISRTEFDTKKREVLSRI